MRITGKNIIELEKESKVLRDLFNSEKKTRFKSFKENNIERIDLNFIKFLEKNIAKAEYINSLFDIVSRFRENNYQQTIKILAVDKENKTSIVDCEYF